MDRLSSIYIKTETLFHYMDLMRDAMDKTFLEVQSLQRALNILEAIGDSSKPISLKALTESTGLPKSTAYRLLANLENRGYVRCNSDGSYQLGMKFLMLSQRVNQCFELKHVVRPFLHQLNEKTAETVHLGMLDKTKIVYVDTVESQQAVRLVAQLGSNNSVHCTSLGKAMLMNTPDEEIVRILEAEGMEARTDYTLTTVADFLADMSEVRKRGYALDNRESALECRCVGAPIVNNAGEVLAAISISGPASRFTLQTIHNEAATLLLDAVKQVSRFLGMIRI